jgi:hypothetical protein
VSAAQEPRARASESGLFPQFAQTGRNRFLAGLHHPAGDFQ